MLSRNDQPLGFSVNFATAGLFNFAVDSVFTINANIAGGGIPPISNAFLLLDNSFFLLLDGSDLLLL
jgi:hypothetical protein